MPTNLRRHEAGEPALDGPALLGGAPGGRLVDSAAGVLRAISATTRVPPVDHLREAARHAGTATAAWSPNGDEQQRFAALVYDASGI
jgi:3-oxoacyl-[acyl-carrier protein] reductase